MTADIGRIRLLSDTNGENGTLAGRKGGFVLILWRIRYLDRRDRKFKDRDLYLLTTSLDAPTKAAVEFLMETNSRSTEREIFKFRPLFQEMKSESLETLMVGQTQVKTVCLSEYYEDENCHELTTQEMGPILTGEQNVILVRSGMESHDIDYMLADQPPVPMAEVILTTDQVKLFGYFCRDLKELMNSEFMKADQAVQLRWGGDVRVGEAILETAVTDDEIRSFITIFRRLYMTTEHADFLKSAEEFSLVLGEHPRGRWVKGVANSYKAKMGKRPAMCFGQFDYKLERQRLLDIFIYTRYAHQPHDNKKKPDQQRERQFSEYLQEVRSQESVLTWLFLSELRTTAGEMKSAGRIIAAWFKGYCEYKNISPNILDSLLLNHPGIGKLEKEVDRRQRLLGEKTQELAQELWKQDGYPATGPVHFLHQAHEQLTKALNGGVVA